MADNTAILTKVKEKFSHFITETAEFRGELTIVVKKEGLISVLSFLKEDPELNFNYLADLCGVDYKDSEPRFAVTYQLYSIPDSNHSVRVKTYTDSVQSKLPTVTNIWKTANWHEREVYDMFGIKFEGHPDLRRILMPDNFVGHPLRKDYPVF